MPEATPFAALGRGNGFPFCPTRVDVDTYDAWITLGGFKKTDGGSPSQAQIDLSLANAMKLFWLVNGCDIKNQDDESYSIDFDAGDYDRLNFFGDPHIEPYSRVCNTSGFEGKKSVSDTSPDSLYLQSPLIVKMFSNGVFVGYGVQRFLYVSTADFFTSITGVSHQRDQTWLPDDPDPVNEYITFGGIDFLVSVIYVSPFDTLEIDASPDSVAVYLNKDLVINGNSREESFVLSNLNFYEF